MGLKLPELAGEPYGVVVADPPWKYEDRGFQKPQRWIEHHYDTLETPEICDMDWNGNLAADCILYLWTTAPKYPDALEVMESWGFRYKTQFCWVKPGIGLGIWARNQHELVLLGVRGKKKAPGRTELVSSVFYGPSGRHSEKPGYLQDMIDGQRPGVRKLELFARRRRMGWDSWGLEFYPLEEQG